MWLYLDWILFPIKHNPHIIPLITFPFLGLNVPFRNKTISTRLFPQRLLIIQRVLQAASLSACHPSVPNHRCHFSSCRQPTHPHVLIYCLSPPHLSPQPRIQLCAIPTETPLASFNTLPQLEMQEEITRGREEEEEESPFFLELLFYTFEFLPCSPLNRWSTDVVMMSHEMVTTHTHRADRDWCFNKRAVIFSSDVRDGAAELSHSCLDDLLAQSVRLFLSQ